MARKKLRKPTRSKTTKRKATTGRRKSAGKSFFIDRVPTLI